MNKYPCLGGPDKYLEGIVERTVKTKQTWASLQVIHLTTFLAKKLIYCGKLDCFSKLSLDGTKHPDWWEIPRNLTFFLDKTIIPDAEVTHDSHVMLH